MGNKEWLIDQWKWNEEKIKEYIKRFEEYLNQEGGEIKKRQRKREDVQKYLQDEDSIDKLSNKELVELFKNLDSYKKSRRRPDIINNYEEIKTWLKELIKISTTDILPKGPPNIGVGITSELLTLRYPEKFYLINNKSVEGIKALGSGELPGKDNPKSYPKWRPLFEYLRNQIEKCLKEADFYDVDHFLWYITDKKEKPTDKEKLNKKVESSKVDRSPTEKQLLLTDWFEAKGFYFDENLVKAFYSALKTKGFVILSGLSGTGKTKLAQIFAELLCPCKKCHGANKQPDSESCNDCTHIFLSVRPDWRDGKPLLGYYNPLSEKYESTPLLSFILKAIEEYKNKKDKANPYFIILDEMNLSHVEYYFADFLSVLESGRDEDFWTKETIKLHNFKNKLESNDGQKIQNEIKLPPNFYIIGTVNIDETTYMFSPKVLDRAFTLEFKDVNFDRYINGFQQDTFNEKQCQKLNEELLKDLKNIKNGKARFCGAIADKEEIKEAIKMIKNNKIVNEKTISEEIVELNQTLQPHDLHFGYRVLDEMALFIKYATEAPDVIGKLSEKEALDFAVLMKVLPKFHGPRQKLEKPLRKILTWCANKFTDKGDNKLE